MTEPDFLLLVIPAVILLVLAWVRGGESRIAVPVPGFEWLPHTRGYGRLYMRTGNTLRAMTLIALVPLVVVPSEKTGKGKRDSVPAFVVVLDNSSSMTAGDFLPFGRLEAAKRSLRSFIMRQREAEVGLIALAASPRVAAPVTPDRKFVIAALEKIGPASYEDDGTAIGSGVASAINRLRDDTGKTRRILLVTDGVSNRGSVSAADMAEVANALGIHVDTIGIGTDSISRFTVPGPDGAQQEVEARIEIDDRALDSLSTRTGGSYCRVSEPAGLDRALAGLEASYLPEGVTAGTNGSHRWTAILAMAALGLLGTELLLRYFIFREIPQ